MSFTSRFKRNFVSGLVLILPLVVTLYVLRILVNWSFQFVNPIVRETRLVQYTANVEVIAQVLAAVLIVAAIATLGFLAQWRVGRQVFGKAGRVVNLIPLVNTIYTSTRQVANSLVERDTRYESVVLVEHPRYEMYSLGLVTAESPESVEPVTGGPAYNVFLPNSPNPTAGRLVVVPDDQVHEIDMSVRQGLRYIVTTGMGGDDEPDSLPTLEEETRRPAGRGENDADDTQ